MLTLLSLSLLVWYPTSIMALVTLPPNETVPGVIVSDTGNNITTLIKSNFLPYGKDFGGGKPTGRFCDGKVPADIIARELDIKDVVPAYLDQNVTNQDLITGVSFGSGGSGFDPLTPKLVSVISLTQQPKYFEEYIGKLKGAAGEEKANFTLVKSIFLLVAGSDDIANTYIWTIRRLGLRRKKHELLVETEGPPLAMTQLPEDQPLRIMGVKIIQA